MILLPASGPGLYIGHADEWRAHRAARAFDAAAALELQAHQRITHAAAAPLMLRDMLLRSGATRHDFLSELLRTSTGKVLRRALHEPNRAGRSSRVGGRGR